MGNLMVTKIKKCMSLSDYFYLHSISSREGSSESAYSILLG